jgi:hypothetical protein
MAISAKTARYVRLNDNGFEIGALEFREVRLGRSDVPEELALDGDIEKIAQHLMLLGYDTDTAVREAKNARDFYGLGSDCLWLTFARDHLWWTFAHPHVLWMANDVELIDRVRKSVGGWRNTDIHGVPIKVDSLSEAIKGLACLGRADPDAKTLGDLLELINGNAASKETDAGRSADLRSSGKFARTQASSNRVPSALFTVEDVLKAPSAAPNEPGLYAWWFDKLPDDVPLAGAPEQTGFRLAYIGIASHRPGSRRTLRQRLRNHCNGPIAASTLRRSLAAVLIDQLNLHPFVGDSNKVKLPEDEEARLSKWLSTHGRVAWIVDATPWAYEAELLKSGLPLALNIRGGSHEFGRKLLTLRKQLSSRSISVAVSSKTNDLSCRQTRPPKSEDS